MKKNKILIVDGSSYIYRAFHTPSLSRLTTPSGELSGTVFGFNRSLNIFLEEYNPTHCCIVFDPRGKTQRHEYFPQYKANRPSTPAEIIIAYQQVQELLAIKNIATLQVEKQEADDVIGSLSKKLSTPENLIIIASGDKDLAQLVSSEVILTNIKKGVIEKLDEEGIKEKMGIYPNQVADYLALMGDSVDNIPGVPGVGAKTAVKLINEHQNIHEITQKALLIGGKVGKAIEEEKENIPLYLRLTQIDCQIPLSIDLEGIEIKQKQNVEKQAEYYKKMGFVSELSKIKEENNNALEEKKEAKKSIEMVDSVEQWLGFVSQQGDALFLLQNKKTVYGYDPSQQRVLGIEKSLLKKSSIKALNEKINKTLEKRIVAYDWKDLRDETNIDPSPSQKVDLSLFFYILYAGKTSAQWKSAQKEISRLQQKEKIIEIEELAFLEDALSVFEQYAFLENAFYQQIKQDAETEYIYEKIEKPLENILLETEKKGVFIDQQKLQETDELFSQQISEVQKQIYQQSKEPFNIDSPKQVGEILYTKLNLPVLQKTPTGTPSTNEETLQNLALDGHQIAQQIIQYRGLAKLQSTYTRGLLKHITTQKRIHTKLNQTVTATGRLSSSEPNLQNIPIKTANGRRIRAAFCAPEGRLLMAADYSQIELRILAHQTQDEQLIKAFNQDLDIHRVTASKVFKQAEDTISAEQRRYAKTINFGLIYGMSAFSLSKQLKISLQEAKRWIESYFKQFPKIENYMEEVKASARKQESVRTLMGRKIHTPDINNRNYKLRSYAERAAINAPIQGAAADIIKIAMIDVYNKIKEQKDIDLVLQVHDELLFEVDENKASLYEARIRDIMQGATALSVPLKVEIGVAKNWAEAH